MLDRFKTVAIGILLIAVVSAAGYIYISSTKDKFVVDTKTDAPLDCGTCPGYVGGVCVSAPAYSDWTIETNGDGLTSGLYDAGVLAANISRASVTMAKWDMGIAGGPDRTIYLSRGGLEYHKGDTYLIKIGPKSFWLEVEPISVEYGDELLDIIMKIDWVESDCGLNSDDTERPLSNHKTNAERYINDESFVSFLRSIQSSECINDRDPNISSVTEADLTGDGENELVVNATSCMAYSSGSDMNFVAGVSTDGEYSLLKIDAGQDGGPYFIGYYSGLGVEDNVLVYSRMIHNPGDAGCCPTGGTDKKYLEWNGAEFVVTRMEHISFRSSQ